VRIRIGVHYDPRRGAGDAPDDALFAALLQHAAAAEEAGAAVAWVAERPTEEGALIPAALPVCAALAARTRRLRVGTAVLPLPLHHPLRVAEDAATLDGLSGGRFELGLGLGADAEGAGGFGVASGERATRLEEAVALIRAAWQDAPVSFQGRHHSVSKLEVHPKSTQAGGPPLWIGAGAAEAQRRAARLGTGLWLPPGASPRPFLDAWTEAGRDPAAARVARACRDEPDDALRDAGDLLCCCAGSGQVDLGVAVHDLGAGADGALLVLRRLAERFPGRSA
jgi:alkanesulfonate monooxygenase SsuD/methylene tetrahydromethanopterin reductase-like flavin-dependent oxidoreductase (luciferase family)